MTLPRYALAAALAFAVPAVALADDDGTRPQSPSEPTGAATTRVTLLGEGATAMRFNVVRDRAVRNRLNFRLLDRRAKLGLPPIVVLRTATGPREVTLTAVEGESDVWYLADDAVAADSFDATLRVTVDGKAITGPVVVATTPTGGDVVVAPAHGGRWLPFDECGFMMEVVQDFESGTLTFYGSSRAPLDRPPAVTISEGGGVTMSEAAVVEGKQAVWKFSSSAFKKRETIARVRVLVRERPCEAALTIPPHGGRIVMVAGGPQIEIVRTEGQGLRVFVLEDRIGEKPLSIDNAVILVTTAEGDRSFPLVGIKGETRAWEITRLESPAANGKVRLRFTNAGRLIETDLAPIFVVAK